MTPLRFSLCLLAPLAACNLGDRASGGDCPDDEFCSGDTPHGLHFEGATLGDTLIDLAPYPTLAGGTQDIRLTYDRGDGGLRPLDRPYLADDDGGAGVKVERTAGPVVTLRGVAGRSNYLRITDLDGALYDRKQLHGATLSEIRVLPTKSEQVTSADVVFAPGGRDVTVALFGETSGGAAMRTIDQSMELDFPGATRLSWDTLRLPALAVGRHPLAITVGDRPAASLDVEVVAAADDIVAQPVELPLLAGRVTSVCFSARAAARHIVGLSWTFTTDNGTAERSVITNCAAVKPDRLGTLNLTASAGGKTMIVSLSVAAAATARTAAEAADQPPAVLTTAGERAAAF